MRVPGLQRKVHDFQSTVKRSTLKNSDERSISSLASNFIIIGKRKSAAYLEKALDKSFGWGADSSNKVRVINTNSVILFLNFFKTNSRNMRNKSETVSTKNHLSENESEKRKKLIQ